MHMADLTLSYGGNGKEDTMDAETTRMPKQVPIACDLPGGELRIRREDISREIFNGCQSVRELEDGYEFVFPGSIEWVEGLALFIAAERECSASSPSSFASNPI